MKKMTLIVTLFSLIIGILFGCASTPQEKSANSLMEMQLKKNNYISKEKIFAGLGIGVSKDQQIALEKADQNARVDLAKEIDSRVKALVKNFKEDVGDETSEHFQSTSETLINTQLNGATLVDIKVETSEDGQYTIYGVMPLKVDIVEEYIKTIQGTDSATEALKEKIRAAADKAYAELEEQTAK